MRGFWLNVGMEKMKMKPNIGSTDYEIPCPGIYLCDSVGVFWDYVI